MFLLWSTLVSFLFNTRGISPIRQLSEETSTLNSNDGDTCNEYVDLNTSAKNPVIYSKKNIKKGTVICVNASSIYMSIIFHTWNNFEAKTFRIDTRPKKINESDKNSFTNLISKDSQKIFTDFKRQNNQSISNFRIKNEGNQTIIIEDGPYKEKDNIIGFYFGRYLGQVQLKALKNNAALSFGSIIFHEKSTLRIISNSKQDTLKFLEPRVYNRSRYPCHRHIQYFNGLPGSQSYNIDMSLDEEEDYLNFRNSRRCSMNFTGDLSIQKKTTEEEPQTLNFFTNKNYNLVRKEPISNSSLKERRLEVYLEIDENSNLVKSKKFGRLWTSSSKYATIPAFSYSEYSPGWIVLTVVLAVVLVISIVAIISFIIFKKRKSRFTKCDETCDEGIANNQDNDPNEKAPKKKRRMFFESIVEICHAPKNQKDESSKNSSQKKDDDALKISQSHLLDQVDEH